MESNEQPPLYFSETKPETNNSPAPEQKQSPYLKAILNGNLQHSARVVKMALSDRLAAIRYIRESKWRHNFFRG